MSESNVLKSDQLNRLKYEKESFKLREQRLKEEYAEMLMSMKDEIMSDINKPIKVSWFDKLIYRLKQIL